MKILTSDVCKWSLVFSFKEKERVVEFIRILLDQEINFPFEFEHRLLDVGEDYTVTVNDMSWAHNLTTVAKILEGVDFSMGWDDEGEYNE